MFALFRRTLIQRRVTATKVRVLRLKVTLKAVQHIRPSSGVDVFGVIFRLSKGGSLCMTWARDLLNCLLPSLEAIFRLYGFGALLNVILQPIDIADQEWASCCERLDGHEPVGCRLVS